MISGRKREEPVSQTIQKQKHNRSVKIEPGLLLSCIFPMILDDSANDISYSFQKPISVSFLIN